MTPTQRTLKALRDQGMVAEIVERWIPIRLPKGKKIKGKPRTGIRKDFLGIIDIIAFIPYTTFAASCPQSLLLGIQSTGQDFAGHLRKIKEHADSARMWLSSGALLQLWSWRKVKVKRGGKATRWEARVKEITERDLA